MSLEEKSFWKKYKKIIIGLLVIVVCFLFVFPFIYCGYNNVSDFTKGMLGTLIGACVGGFFTLKGSLAINKNVQKAQNAIRRKNVIYKPLYDELNVIHNVMLRANPFPSVILFEKSTLYPGSIQYTVWGRIKKDARFFEVVPKVKNAMESLYASIYLYMEKHKNAVAALNKIYTDSIYKILNKNIDCFIWDSTLLNVLQETRPKKILGRGESYDLETENLVWGEIIKMARINDELKQCKEAKVAWNMAEEHALEELGTHIQYIIAKYEE